MTWDLSALSSPPTAAFFDPARWRGEGRLLSQAEGRGAAYFLRAAPDTQWVLRHYRRGGLLARVNHDHYLWTGAARTRPGRELRLLARLYNQGLPVPRPVAAQARRRAGMVYTADLITQVIDCAATLADRLAKRPLAVAGWRALGRTIAELHSAGVWHADLNARNVLMVDEATFYLIDFDRARFRVGDRSWRQANLARLRRSLDKLAARHRDFYFTDNDWIALSRGYQSVVAGLERL